MAERRAVGRKTYGKGLTHTDSYDWNRMAMEEALDLAQYLAAENLRLRQERAAVWDECHDGSEQACCKSHEEES